jgi:hypothetical protein
MVLATLSYNIYVCLQIGYLAGGKRQITLRSRVMGVDQGAKRIRCLTQTLLHRPMNHTSFKGTTEVTLSLF